MLLLKFIRNRLSRTILSVLAVSVAAVLITLVYVTAFIQTRDMVKALAVSSEDIAHTIYASIKHPMSVGDSDAVENNLLDLKEQREDIEVFICDFEQKIIYATHKERVNSKVNELVADTVFLHKLDETLKKGEHPSNSLEESRNGRRYITTAHPILNSKECHHCHGSSRKVLGGMVVRKSADSSYAAIASLRDRNILLTLFGLCAIIALIYITLSNLVKRPLTDFTGRITELTARIPSGDYSMRIDIRRPDEIGELISAFNHMAETLEDKNSALQKAHTDIIASNKELEAFAYSVSHDLRAPLRNIDGFSKILLEEYSPKLDDKAKHYLSRVRNGTSKMSMLIDDMLTFSRVGRIEVQLRSVDCNKAVNNVLHDFAGEISARNISVRVGELPIIMCDPTMIQNVFSNLVSNALKFTRNAEMPELVIGFDKDKEAIFVKDNGIGFDMQYHNKIFQIFQRLHLPEEYEGTGIGLAIVKRIVERQHGSIWAESEPGNGAVFFVKLPAAETPQEKDDKNSLINKKETVL